MKKTILLTAATLALLAGACNSSTQKDQTGTSDSTAVQPTGDSQKFDIDTTRLAGGTAYYQCEMHPEVISDRPGNCNKCSMKLIEKRKL